MEENQTIVEEEKPRSWIVDLGEDIFYATIVPAIKDIIFNAGKELLQSILFGGDGREVSRGRHDYSRYSRRSPRSSSSRGVREIEVGSRDEGAEVIDTLKEIVSDYGMLTLADVKDISGETPKYTDNSVGWTNPRFKLVYGRGGRYYVKILNSPRTF